MYYINLHIFNFVSLEPVGGVEGHRLPDSDIQQAFHVDINIFTSSCGNTLNLIILRYGKWITKTSLLLGLTPGG